jgi:hypothetical protein
MSTATALYPMARIPGGKGVEGREMVKIVI